MVLFLDHAFDACKYHCKSMLFDAYNITENGNSLVPIHSTNDQLIFINKTKFIYKRIFCCSMMINKIKNKTWVVLPSFEYSFLFSFSVSFCKYLLREHNITFSNFNLKNTFMSILIHFIFEELEWLFNSTDFQGIIGCSVIWIASQSIQIEIS